jgi:hypothetical protein
MQGSCSASNGLRHEVKRNSRKKKTRRPSEQGSVRREVQDLWIMLELHADLTSLHVAFMSSSSRVIHVIPRY